MKKNSELFPALYPLLAFLLAAGLSLNSAQSYPNGAPPGYANDPPATDNCSSCHQGNGLNLPPGTFTLNLPQAYKPDSTYLLTLTLSRVGMLRWGFELTAQLNDSTRGGNLIVLNTQYTQKDSGSGTHKDYLKQTSDGTFPGTADQASWTFNWIAPGTGSGPVAFYASGLAANDDDSPSGDYVYTFSQTVQPQGAGVVDPGVSLPSSPWLLSAYPNPFNPNLTINLNGPAMFQPLTLELVDAAGRLVFSRDLPGWTGVATLPLDLSYLPSGTYLLRTSQPEIAPIRLVKVK